MDSVRKERGKGEREMEFLEGVQVIVMLVFMVINWVLYHRVFDGCYFGEIGKGIFKELLVSFIVAILELALLETYPVILVIIAVIVIATAIVKR